MFSSRFFEMVDWLTHLGVQVGSFRILFNRNSLIFLYSIDPTVVKKLKGNFYLVLVIILSALVTILRHKINGNFTKYIMAATYFIGVLVITMIFSILKWFGEDVTQISNYLTGLFRQIERKCNLKNKIDKTKAKLNI